MVAYIYIMLQPQEYGWFIISWKYGTGVSHYLFLCLELVESGEQVKCVVDIVAKMAMPFWLKSSPCDQASRKNSDFLFLPMAALSPVASEPGTLQWPLSQSSTWRQMMGRTICWLTCLKLRLRRPRLLLLAALGCPLSWHKTALPEVNTCLGFQVNPCGPVVDFPMDKKTTLGELLHKISSGASFTAKELERALGRLNWATAAWPLSRPFLQPFWAWKAATTSSGRQQTHPVFCSAPTPASTSSSSATLPIWPPSNWWGASDASAHPVDGAYIGGWIADRENPSKEHTWWFHYKVPLEEHHWAHKDGDPTRRIAALEMFGTLILTNFLLILGGKSLLRTDLVWFRTIKATCMPCWTRRRSTLHMPTSAFLMQLIVMIHSAGVQLAPSHMKRDYNRWADELTHPNFEGFQPDRQRTVSEAFSDFKFLWALLDDQSMGPQSSGNNSKR